MGMPMTHVSAAGMGGIRTAGDLVAWMQTNRKMRINDAKAYVADKLNITELELSDPYVMRDIREELDIGIITGVPGCAKGMIAKARIADLLDIEINSVKYFRDKLKVS